MRSVTLKSAMTPSFIGLMATMLPGVRPSISLASLPTASTSLVFLFSATMEGSFTTMPLPRAYTSVLAVPRSIARSLENMLNRERKLWKRDAPLYPFFDMAILLSLGTSAPPRNRAGPFRCQAPYPCTLYPIGCSANLRASFAPAGAEHRILLNHDLLLAGIDPALGILRRHRDQAFAAGQGWREIVKRAIVGHDRHFPAVHHHPRPRLGPALHFDHVSVLDERLERECQLNFLLALGNDGEA